MGNRGGGEKCGNRNEGNEMIGVVKIRRERGRKRVKGVMKGGEGRSGERSEGKLRIKNEV